MLHEIEGVERDIRAREDLILEEMEKAEALARAVQREEARLQGRRAGGQGRAREPRRRARRSCMARRRPPARRPRRCCSPRSPRTPRELLPAGRPAARHRRRGGAGRPCQTCHDEAAPPGLGRAAAERHPVPVRVVQPHPLLRAAAADRRRRAVTPGRCASTSTARAAATPGEAGFGVHVPRRRRARAWPRSSATSAGPRTTSPSTRRFSTACASRSPQGASEVEVFSDSELLVRQIAGRYRVKNPGLLPLFREAQSLLARFERARVTHVPREREPRGRRARQPRRRHEVLEPLARTARQTAARPSRPLRRRSQRS